MKENKTIENVFATIGAVLWAIQTLPQVWKSYRTKSTRGLSPSLMLIWAASALFYVIYAIARRLSIPMQIQPNLSGISFVVSWAQCLYYGCHMSARRTLLCLGGVLVFWGIFEAASVQALWAGQRHGTEVPMLVYGYMATVLSVVGLLPQYYEIYLIREVRGLSLTFIFTDLIGGVFLLISLFFRSSLDISALVIYALTIGMVAIIIILALFLNPAAKKRRAASNAQLPATSQSGQVPVEKASESDHQSRLPVLDYVATSIV